MCDQLVTIQVLEDEFSILNCYMQNVKFELHFAFFHKVQLEVDRILIKTTLQLKMKEE